MSRDQLQDGELQNMLEDLQQQEVLTVSGNRVRFAGAEEHFFANGGWLEDYIYCQVQALRKELPQIQDVARSVKISYWDNDKQTKVENELDVVFLANNRLYVIECKTKVFKGDDINTEAQDALYKLATLTRQAGGREAKGLLATYHALRDIDKQRAPLLGVHVCDGPALKSVRSQIKMWL